ncbi:MAG: hypothetical protein DRQ78_10960 [Epsilonproteobacteria bacterium]|nr:MAG: hypothetical protein DRQ78_10960 [Campylobacterota bacterium]
MRLLFALKEKQGKPVTDTYGYQEVVASVLDGSDQVIVLLDNNTNKLYIEKVINRFDIDLYRSSNFMKIEDKEEWDTYKSFFHSMGIIPDI